MNELELIARVAPLLPTDPSVLAGAGDDCAVLDFGLPGELVLFKTDAIVEGVHFLTGTDPARIGRKAVARCLSDLAAMAGRPTHAVITLGLPAQFEEAFVDALYRGINQIARAHQLAIVGGETVMNPERVFISVAAVGRVERERCVLRSSARVGDAIFVTGTLGGSIAGKHLDFEPRLAEAQWLAKNFSIHAMIDVSDGLASDLRHLLKASGLGAELLTSAIPISPEARKRAHGQSSNGSDGAATAPKTALQAALTDGEDFELLFTVPSREAVHLLDAWKGQFPSLPLHCIGRTIPGSELLLRSKRGAEPLHSHGYLHFAQP